MVSTREFMGRTKKRGSSKAHGVSSGRVPEGFESGKTVDELVAESAAKRCVGNDVLDVFEVIKRATAMVTPRKRKRAHGKGGTEANPIPNHEPARVPLTRPWLRFRELEEQFERTGMKEAGIDESELAYETEEMSELDKRRRGETEGMTTGTARAKEAIFDPITKELQRRREVMSEYAQKKTERERKLREAEEVNMSVGDEIEKMERVTADMDTWSKQRREFIKRQVEQSKAPRGLMLARAEEQHEMMLKHREDNDVRWVDDPGYMFTVCFITNQRTAGLVSFYPMITRLADFYSEKAAQQYVNRHQRLKRVKLPNGKTEMHPDGPLLLVVPLYEEILLHFDNADLYHKDGMKRIEDKTVQVMSDHYQYRALVLQNREDAKVEAGMVDDKESSVELRKRREDALRQKISLYKTRERKISKRQRQVDAWRRRRVAKMSKTRLKVKTHARQRVRGLIKSDIRMSELAEMSQDQLEMLKAERDMAARMQREEDGPFLSEAKEDKPDVKAEQDETDEEEKSGKGEEGDRGEGVEGDGTTATRLVDAEELDDEVDDDGEPVEPMSVAELEERDRKLQKKEMKKKGHSHLYNRRIPPGIKGQTYYLYSIVLDVTQQSENPTIPEAAGKEHVVIMYPSFGTLEDAKDFMMWNLSDQVQDIPIDIGTMQKGLTPDKIIPDEGKEFHREDEDRRIANRLAREKELLRDYIRYNGASVPVVEYDDAKEGEAAGDPRDEATRGEPGKHSFTGNPDLDAAVGKVLATAYEDEASVKKTDCAPQSSGTSKKTNGRKKKSKRGSKRSKDERTLADKTKSTHPQTVEDLVKLLG